MNIKIISTISKGFTIGALWLFVSCSTLHKTRIVDGKGCDEDLEFKKSYFENIQNIENLITTSQNESFHKSLNFISKYSKVSFESMLNYAGVYPYGTFQEDKRNWLQWYEDNRCKNITLRTK